MRLLPKNNGMGWVAYALLGYLGFFLIDPIMEHASPVTWAWTGLGLLLFLIMYFSLYWVCGWKVVAITLGVVLLGVAYLPFNSGASCFFIYGASFPGIPGQAEPGLPGSGGRGLDSWGRASTCCTLHRSHGLLISA